MKRVLFTKGLLSSVFITIFLLNITVKTPSPKIIFIPFLICGFSKIGENVCFILNKEKYASIFRIGFIAGFLLFWFGFLAFASYICIRDSNYSMLLYSMPFWLVGIFFVKNKLFRKKTTSKLHFNFIIIISIVLVLIVIISGVILFILGLMRHDIALFFAGVFFSFGAFTFVLGALTSMGYFDKFKVDILGLYLGVFFLIVGIGIIGLKYIETYSLINTIKTFGFWILIPIMFGIVGIYQIIRCLKK